MVSLSKIAAAGAAAAALILAGTAAAQQPADLQAQNQVEIEPVSDDEIETFVAATEEVVVIIEEWQPKLQSAESEEAARELQQQAQDELVAAVEAKGMSADRYNQINMAAAQDEELAARISAVIEAS